MSVLYGPATRYISQIFLTRDSWEMDVFPNPFPAPYFESLDFFSC